MPTYFSTLFDLPPQREIAALGGDGILTEADMPELRAATRRVYELMRDGQWYAAEAIEEVGGREGLRRMRELRQWFTVERQRCGESRRWVYRLVRESCE